MKTTLSWILCLLAPAFALACGSSDPGPDSSGNAISTGSTTPAPSGSSATTPPSSASPSSGGKVDDKKIAACEDACRTKNAAGAKTLDDLDAKNATCVCAANACASECGASNICKDDDNAPEASDACLGCLDKNAAVAACDQQSDSECAANTDCAAAKNCMDACNPGGDDDDDNSQGDQKNDDES
jgi:hypothetical protein